MAEQIDLNADFKELTARRVLTLFLPALCALLVVATFAQLVVNPDQPRRLVPIALGALVVAIVTVLRHKRRAQLAVHVLIIGMHLAVTQAMFFNGGVRAAGYTALIANGALVGTMYGIRIMMLYVASCFIMGGIFVYLRLNDLIYNAPPLPEAAVWLIISCMILIASVAAYVPINLLQLLLKAREKQTEELQRAHEAERAEAQAFQAVFDQTFQLMGLLDPQGKLLRANETSLKLVDVKPEDVIGKHFAETPWWTDAQRPQLNDAIQRAAAGELVRFRTTHTRKDGKVAIIDFSLSPFRDENGKVVYLIPEGRDITDLVKTEDALKQSQRMEAIGKVAGGVAHDFNNILTGIMGYGELARMELKDHKSVARLDEILKAADRAGNLTKQLLAFSRKQVVQPKVLDINTIVLDMQKMLDRIIGDNIRMENRVEARAYPVKADRSQLEQLLLNLCVNGRDAMPLGGQIIVETRNCTRSDIRAQWGEVGGTGPVLMLSVSDTGSGMTPDVLSHLFEPFYTTKAEGRGTGLGLSTVYGVVRQSEGAIGVDSTPGKGTTFRIYFPAAEGAVENAPRPLPGTDPELYRGTVLVAEDNSMLAQVVTESLMDRGFSVIMAEDGDAALQKARDHKGEIRLMVCDVIMPGKNVMDMIREVRKAHPEIKLLFMSGYVGDRLTLRALEEFEAGFLEKPCTPNMLVAKVKEVLMSGQNHGS